MNIFEIIVHDQVSTFIKENTFLLAKQDLEDQLYHVLLSLQEESSDKVKVEC